MKSLKASVKRRGVSSIGGGGGSRPPVSVTALRYFLPLLSNLVVARGTATPTFTRSTIANHVDGAGNPVTVAVNTPAFDSRRVTNYMLHSEDMTSAGWVAGGAGGTVTATTYTFTAFSNSNIIRQTGFVGTATISVLLSTNSGTHNIRLTTGGVTSGNFLVTTTPKRFSFTGVTTAATTYCGLQNGSDAIAGLVNATDFMFEDVTYQTNQNPSEYLPTTSAAVTQWFGTANGNTVDANGVVTEATGASLSPSGIWSEPASTNKCACYSVPRADSLGVELLTAAQAQCDSGWTLITATVTQTGVLTFTNTPVNVGAYADKVVLGKYYTVSFTIVSITEGGILIRVGSSGLGTVRTTAGTYTETILASGDTLLRVYSDSTSLETSAVLDNVSIKEAIDYVGTKAYHNGTAFQNPITGMTLSGDTAAVLSIVTDSAALATALADSTLEAKGAIAKAITNGGKVYKLDNSLGSTNAYVDSGGLAGNTNNHASSAYWRGSGVGQIRITGNGLSQVAIPATYGRKFNTWATIVNGTHRTEAVSGAILYFLIPQLEEQSFATSEILCEGVATTRGATVLSAGVGDIPYRAFSPVNDIRPDEVYGMGFGVGICPTEDLPIGMTPMTGYDNPLADNYGNYQYSDGSVMCWIPKFYYRIAHANNPTYATHGVNSVDVRGIYDYATTALANADGYALHRMFIDGGLEKSGCFVDKYMVSNNSGTPSSIKNGNPISTAADHNPISGLTGAPTNAYYSAVSVPKLRGADFFCTTRFITAGLALLSLAHGQASSAATYCAWYSAGATNFPKGCNNNALKDVNDTAVTYQTDGYSICGKTGSAGYGGGVGNTFAKTTHNGQNCGVADLNGLMYEINPGLTCITSTKVITGISQANPAVVTSVAHGLTNGTQILITGVVGMTQVNTCIHTVANATANTFELSGVNSTGYTAYTSGGTITRGTFYILKTAAVAKTLTAGNTLSTDVWGATGVAAHSDVISVPFADGAAAKYFGNAANQVLSEATSGDAWKLTGLGFPKDANGVSAAGSSLFGNDYFYEYFVNDMVPLSLCLWNLNTVAGVWSVALNSGRSLAFNAGGFRSACYPLGGI